MPFINPCSLSFPVNPALFSQIHSFLYHSSNTKQPAPVAWVLSPIHSSRPMRCASDSIKYSLKNLFLPFSAAKFLALSISYQPL